MILTGHGYPIIDCGKDCPLPKLMEAVDHERPMAVGVSGLISPVIPLVRQVRPLLRERGLDWVKVMAGGGTLKQSSAEKLNVDFVAESAFDGVRFVAGLTGDGK